jgi:DNA-binding transcriptional ArsR family regulator
MATKRGKQSKKSVRQEAFDSQLIRALSHPVRARALAILNERVASPKEIANELDLPLGNLSYHIRTLKDFGCIELVDEVPRRGATEHYYRGITRSFLNDESWAKLDPTTKAGISVAGLKVINKHAKDAIEADTFDSRNDRHLSCTPMLLDEEGFTEASDLFAETMEGLAVINAAVANRMASADKKPGAIRATAALLFFESPPQPSEKKGS